MPKARFFDFIKYYVGIPVLGIQYTLIRLKRFNLDAGLNAWNTISAATTRLHISCQSFILYYGDCFVGKQNKIIKFPQYVYIGTYFSSIVFKYLKKNFWCSSQKDCKPIIYSG